MVSSILLALATAFTFGNTDGEPLVPVTFAMVESLPDANAHALIVRNGGAEPRDFIVFRKNESSPKVVAAAIAAYLVSRVEFSADPGRDRRILVTSDQAPNSWEREYANFASVLARLRNDPLTTIPNIGPARAVEVKIRAVVPRAAD